jgi:hypothetical protein
MLIDAPIRKRNNYNRIPTCKEFCFNFIKQFVVNLLIVGILIAIDQIFNLHSYEKIVYAIEILTKNKQKINKK